MNNNVIYCLDNPAIDRVILMLTQVIRNFVTESRYVRSVDGFLIILGTLVSEAEELASMLGLSSEDVLKRVFGCIEVSEALRPLARYASDVERIITADPRHRSLRPYLQLIQSHLSNLSPALVELTISRPPLDIIEKIEEDEKHEFLQHYFKKRPVVPWGRIQDATDIFEPGDSRRARRIPVKTLEVKRSSGVLRRLVWVLLIIAIVLFGVAYYMMNYYKPAEYTPAWSTWTSTPSSPGELFEHKPVLRQEVVFTNTALSIEGDYLVVKYYGRWLPYLWAAVNRTIHLVPYPVLDNDSVIADYVLVTSNYSTAKFSLHKLYRLVNGYIYNTTSIKVEIDSPDASKRCYLSYNGTALGFTECESVSFITLPSLFNTMSIHEAVLRYVNSTTVDYLRQHLLGSNGSRGPVDLSWYILDWLDKNTEYDYTSTLTTWFSSAIRDPITFFNTRRGVCSDYALFTVTALIAGGANNVYTLLFETERSSHVTAAVEINNVLYVLDQRLPVYEWADYVDYVFKPVGREMQVIRVWLDSDGLSAIEVFTVDPVEFTTERPDTHPSDRVPVKLVEDSIQLVGRDLQKQVTPLCKWNCYLTWRLLSWKPLKAYTPLFHNYFVKFLADFIVKNAGTHLTRATCLWYAVESDTLILYLHCS